MLERSEAEDMDEAFEVARKSLDDHLLKRLQSMGKVLSRGGDASGAPASIIKQLQKCWEQWDEQTWRWICR